MHSPKSRGESESNFFYMMKHFKNKKASIKEKLSAEFIKPQVKEERYTICFISS